MWRAARASGAAPSFFRPEGNYIDGGIIANNPSLDLLTEIAEYNIASRATGHLDDIVEPTVLLSLGESFFICLLHIQVHIGILRRSQNFVKSSPCL